MRVVFEVVVINHLVDAEGGGRVVVEIPGAEVGVDVSAPGAYRGPQRTTSGLHP